MLTMGQNSVCERRYDESRVFPEHNDLIEKMVSEQTVKQRIGYVFELPLGFNKRKWVAVLVGKNLVCERRYNESRVSLENNDWIEKW